MLLGRAKRDDDEVAEGNSFLKTSGRWPLPASAECPITVRDSVWYPAWARTMRSRREGKESAESGSVGGVPFAGYQADAVVDECQRCVLNAHCPIFGLKTLWVIGQLYKQRLLMVVPENDMHLPKPLQDGCMGILPKSGAAAVCGSSVARGSTHKVPAAPYRRRRRAVKASERPAMSRESREC